MSKLYPWAEAASAYQIDYQKEYDNGVRGVLFDVDNTLVRHGEPATKQAKELFEHLRSIGLKTCIISNNKEPRVSPFAKKVGSDYIYKAGKPSVRGYEDAMKRIHTTPDTTIRSLQIFMAQTELELGHILFSQFIQRKKYR